MGIRPRKGKTVVPLKLENCKVHPRLEPIQYLDFSVPGALPWNLLIERIKEIENEATSEEDLRAAAAADQAEPPQDLTVKAILGYPNQRGYQMVSYERLRKRIDTKLTDEKLDEIVDANSSVFRRVTLKDGRRGLAAYPIGAECAAQPRAAGEPQRRCACCCGPLSAVVRSHSPAAVPH